MPDPTLDQLAAELQQDEALLREFQQITDEDIFVARSVEVAHARGYDHVTEADVRAYIDARRNSSLSEAELDQAVGGFCVDYGDIEV